MAMLKLTADNYYSNEANWAYMSTSQYKNFARCESAALAELKGEWSRKDSIALLVGSYVDAHFSGEKELFITDHPEIYTKSGTLRAEFQNAEKAIARLEADELAKMLLSGRNQVIKTVKINGVWFKAKFDSLLTPRQVEAICEKFPEVRQIVPFGGAMIVDLKYMKDFEPMWDEEVREYLNFITYWGYDTQGAIYQYADKRNAPFVIVAVTKDDEPDITARYIPDDELEYCLALVKENAPRYAAIKRGEIEPRGCGKCAYCRSQKKLSSIAHFMEI
jgi:hypothetical protein